MKVGQLIDGIRSTDWLFVFSAQPWELLFEQHQHLLDKRLRGVILDCHVVLLKEFKDWKMGQLERD